MPVADQNGGPAKGPFLQPDAPVINQTSNANSVTYQSDYYFLGQFARFVKAGATRIASDAGSSNTVTDVAFKNPDGQLVVVIANATSSSQSFKLLTPSGQISSTLPANTVGTYLWTPTTSSSGLQNGGFENGFSPWTVENGSAGQESNYPHSGSYDAYLHPDGSRGAAAGVESNYPHTGSYDGYLHPSASTGASIVQQFTAPATGTYTLSAYCASSNGVSASFGIDVNGSQRINISIANGGYAQYSRSLSVNAGDTINVWYYAPSTSATSPWATIDDVSID